MSLIALVAPIDAKTNFHLRFSGNGGNRPFRVLSIDGGGVRGVYAARILERICKQCPSLLDNVDLIAGSSTGALIGILLSMGYTPASVVKFYITACPHIFSRSSLRSYNPFLSRYRGFSKASVFHQVRVFSCICECMIWLNNMISIIQAKLNISDYRRP
jgi:hypothetical protein